MDEAVRAYIDAIAPEHRALFDRLHRLILEVHPDAVLALSYQIPAYRPGAAACTSGRGSTACRSTAGRPTTTPDSPPAPGPHRGKGNDPVAATGRGGHRG
jgi:hypothetical protein